MPLKPEHTARLNKLTATDHRGKPLDQKALLQPNPMVLRVLAARAQQLTDEDRSALKQILTPQTMPAIKKLLPELAKVMGQGMNANAG